MMSMKRAKSESALTICSPCSMHKAARAASVTRFPLKSRSRTRRPRMPLGIHSPEPWVAWKCAVSRGRARRLVAMARRLPELPHTASASPSGALCGDQVAVVPHAPAYADAEVAELAELAHRVPAGSHPSPPSGYLSSPPTAAPLPADVRIRGALHHSRRPVPVGMFHGFPLTLPRRRKAPTMAVDESTRRLVHEWAAHSGGPDVAEALMAMLPPVPAAELATRADIERMEAGLRGDMERMEAGLRGDMAGVRGEMAEVRGEMAELRAELRGEMAELRAEVRGETIELRGEIRSMLPRLYVTNVAGMFGVAGLVLAAARFA